MHKLLSFVELYLTSSDRRFLPVEPGEVAHDTKRVAPPHGEGEVDVFDRDAHVVVHHEHSARAQTGDRTELVVQRVGRLSGRARQNHTENISTTWATKPPLSCKPATRHAQHTYNTHTHTPHARKHLKRKGPDSGVENPK